MMGNLHSYDYKHFLRGSAVDLLGDQLQCAVLWHSRAVITETP